MPVSPSNLHRRIACPGSEALESAAPPELQSEAAARGTRLHALMARLAEGDFSPPPADLPAADFEAVGFAYRTVEPMLKKAQEMGMLILVESQLDLSMLGLNIEDDPERVRMDLALVAPGDHAALVDYKFGAYAGLDPEYDWQFKAYAVGLRINYGVQRVEVMRLQPALDEDRQKRVATFDALQLDEFAAQIKAATGLCYAEDAPVSKGSHCKFCKAFTICPAQSGAIAYVVPPGVAVGPYMASLPPAERKVLFENVLTAAQWVAEVLKHAEGFILQGGHVPGYEIGETRSDRKFRNELEAEQVLRSLFVQKGKDTSLISPPKLISPAAAEDILGKSKPIKDAIAAITERPPGKPKVVQVKIA